MLEKDAAAAVALRAGDGTAKPARKQTQGDVKEKRARNSEARNRDRSRRQ
jgi:hypothetical protein